MLSWEFRYADVTQRDADTGQLGRKRLWLTFTRVDADMSYENGESVCGRAVNGG